MADFGDIVVRLTTDNRPLQQGLGTATKDTKSFTSGLSKELAQATKTAESLALGLVRGSGVMRAELEKAVAKEQQLRNQREAQIALLEEVRRRVSAVATVEAQRGRQQEDQLTRTRRLIERVAASYERQGRVGGPVLSRLVQMENQLTAAKQRQVAMIDRARAATLAEGVAAQSTAAIRRRAFMTGAVGGGMGSAVGMRMFGTAAAFGLSDAATAAQFGGGRAAAMSIANNLPMMGEGLSQVGAAAARAGGPLGKIGGFLMRWAGPTGLVMSVAVPLAAAFAPALLDIETAAEKAEKSLAAVDKRLADIKNRMEADQRLSDLRGGEGVEDQRKRVTEARNEQQALITAQRELTQRIGFAEVSGASSDQIADMRRQLQEVERRLREAGQRVRAEEFALREGEAVLARRNPGPSSMGSGPSTIEQDLAYRNRADRERFAEQRRRAAERERLRGLDDESMQRSILSGLVARLGGLQRQRAAFERGPRRSFERPELATRGNAMDRIIDIRMSKREAQEDSYRKAHLEKIDKQIEATEKLIAAVKEQKPGLKPVGVR